MLCFCGSDSLWLNLQLPCRLLWMLPLQLHPEGAVLGSLQLHGSLPAAY